MTAVWQSLFLRCGFCWVEGKLHSGRNLRESAEERNSPRKALADDLRIQRLVVLSGTCASGKSFLMDRLASTECFPLKSRLVGDRPFTPVPKRRDLDLLSGEYACMAFPANPMRFFEWRRGRWYLKDGTVPELWGRGKEIVFVNLWADPCLLSKRVEARLEEYREGRRLLGEAYCSAEHFAELMWTVMRLKDCYRRRRRCFLLWEAWGEFTAARGETLWLNTGTGHEEAPIFSPSPPAAAATFPQA